MNAPITITETNKYTNKTIFAKKDVEIIDKAIMQILSEADTSIRPILKHILYSGGKRVRPLLIIKSGECFGTNNYTKLINAALSFELIHMASLVHDDIIDTSEKRHGKATVNLVWGTHCAVLIGDYLFAKALGILRSFDLFSCFKEAVLCIEQMSEGEIYQYNNKFNIDINIEVYFNTIYKKTACLMSSCCKCGAMISNASDNQIECLENFGLNLGYAFQITDDILDFIGREEIMGKPVGHDILQGQATLPLILFNNDIKCKQTAGKVFNAQSSKDELSALVGAICESDAIQKSKFITALHIEKAKSALTDISPSISKDMLLELSDNLLERTM